MGKEAKYAVRLEPGQREYLEAIIRESSLSETVLKRAQVLLMADASAKGPGSSDEDIARLLKVCVSTVHNVRQRFTEQGLAAAVARKPAEGRQYSKLTRKQADHLVALAGARLRRAANAGHCGCWRIAWWPLDSSIPSAGNACG